MKTKEQAMIGVRAGGHEISHCTSKTIRNHSMNGGNS